MILTTTYQSKELFYRIHGTGDPVILLHGFGEDGEVWREQVPQLSEDFRLIIPDLPGSGRSGLLAGDNISISDYADAVKAVLDAEDIDSCYMLGHSMGGYITLAFAEKYPQLLKGFGLVHSSAYADSEEKKATREKAIQFIEKHNAYEFLTTSIPGLFGPGFTVEHNDSIQALVERGRNFTAEALIQYYRAMINRPDRTHLLRNLDMPVLFILGVHDKAVPFEQGLQQSYLPALSHVHILRHSAHMGMWEEAGTTTDAIRSFLSA